MSIQLPVDIYAPDQLSELVLELQTYTGELRDAAAKAKSSGQNVSPPEPSDALASLLNASSVSPDDGAAIEQLGQELQKMLNSLPVAHIVLATPPPRTFKRQLTLWFRTEISQNMLLTFAARGDIGGGAIVQAGSHLYDLSFRRAIIKNKKRLTEIAGV